MKKICPICYQIFESKRVHHIYCSVHCRKVHHKRVYYDKKRPVPQYNNGDTVLLEFKCKRCNKLVCIVNEWDRRKKFCSPRCEKLYWKHSHNKFNKKASGQF